MPKIRSRLFPNNREDKMGREDDIRSLAYSLWEQEGYQEGRDYEYWLRAEVVWEQQNPGATTKQARSRSKPSAEKKGKVTSSNKR